MADPVKNYWKIRLLKIKDILEKNNFDAYIADNCSQAGKIVMEDIISNLNIKRVSRGGSKTVEVVAPDALKSRDHIEFIDPFEAGISGDARRELMREALLSDLFITGTNAITEDGKLVNLDSIGNRIAAVTFGPEFVIILTGRNKIVPDLAAAMNRIKNYAAPANAMKLGKKTPCVKTSQCMDCKSPDRICNAWSIIEKSNPKGRIKVLLINEDLGL